MINTLILSTVVTNLAWKIAEVGGESTQEVIAKKFSQILKETTRC